MTVKRLTLFAHFDAQSEVKAFVSCYLRELRQISDRLVFISTPDLPHQQRARAAQFSDEVLLKNSLGFDFGKWRLGLEDSQLEDYDELLLTNSSIFGPLWPLAPYMETMQKADCNFWGMTENFEISWHIQSYFLVFKRVVLRSDAFHEFWSGVLPYSDKSQVIRSYEVGLSTFLKDAGFSGAAFIGNESLFPKGVRRRAFKFTERNPTRFYPERLIEEGMPFVKVEVLRDNPGGVPLDRIRYAMQKTGYDERLVEFDRAASTNAPTRSFYFHHLQRPLVRLLGVAHGSKRSSLAHRLRREQSCGRGPWEHQ